MASASANTNRVFSFPCVNAKGDFIHHFNSKNAKLVSFFIVCGFVLYHTILRLTHGIDSCQWLLSDGNFRDLVWQPYGCMNHHYSHLDTRRCLRYEEYWGRKNYFVFIGDTRTEQLYHSFVHQIAPTYKIYQPTSAKPSKSEQEQTQKQQQLHQTENTIDNEYYIPNESLFQNDLSYNDSQLGLRVQFIWNLYPNKTLVNQLQKWKTSDDRPSVLVMANGANSIIQSSDPIDDTSTIDEYTESLTLLVAKIDRLAELGTKILWMVQEPVDEEKLTGGSWSKVTNERIDNFNYNSMKIIRHSRAEIWSSGRLVAMENIKETLDGYNFGPKTLFHNSQILLNMYCNDNMNFNDATCCSSSEKVSNLQVATFGFLGTCVILAVFTLVKIHIFGIKKKSKEYTNLRYNGNGDYISIRSNNQIQIENNESSPFNPIMALARLALIMSFFFICDRTTMFMKENKYFTQTNFWLPVVYILVLGIFFTEDSTYTKVLHFDQDNETKGWMILLILVYNMMGASQVLPIFMFVKILYSAFLFLHGWSQFTNYLQRGDYSIPRLVQDLVRLNMMTVLVCFCMNRPYQQYYLIPLISFWTLVGYIALSAPPRITWAQCENNSLNYLYIVLKLVGIFSFATILYISEVFFEKLFVTRPWKALFVTTDDDIHDWWSRWKIDRYSMPCGMVLAFANHIARRYKILEDDNHGNLFSTRISLLAIFSSMIGIGGYCAFTLLCRNKLECVEIHSYVLFMPITGYILLRNVSGILRTRFSAFFAWFGQFWIEMIVGQYHIWMGADGHGVLVLVPSYPVGNVLLTAFVFACAAHEIHSISDILIPYIAPSEDWRKTLRNVFIFLIILIPVGVKDGMF